MQFVETYFCSSSARRPFLPDAAPAIYSRAVPIGWAKKLGGRPTGFRRAPLVRVSQPISRVLDGMRTMSAYVTAIPLRRRLPGAFSNLPGRPDLDTDPEALRACARKASHRPYSVLLPVGFAVPPTLLPARCALTAPFHPCRSKRYAPRRSVLCGTVPGLAPAGCYPAPLVHGARTFLPGNLSVFAGAAVRPTDKRGMGVAAAAVKRCAWRHVQKDAGLGGRIRTQ